MTGSERAAKRTEDLVERLIQLHLTSREALPKADIEAGRKLISVFENSQFSLSFRNYREVKKELLWNALHDLTLGGEGFCTGIYQIVFANGQLRCEHRLFGESSSGELVYSVSLKKVVAFQNFRKAEADELSQDDVNFAILYLVTELAGI